MTGTARPPTITVVTPTFNMGDRLPRCVESVSTQRYVALEHIVVDGGSTDGTVDYLGTERRVRWISEPDDGQSDAINKGFRMATGDVIGWLNADDTLAPGVLDAVGSAFNDPDLGWTYGDMSVTDGNRSWVERAPERLDWNAMVRGNVIGQPGSFYARWALDKVGLLDTSFHYTMDFDLFLRFIKAGITSRHLGMVVAGFELHAGSKSGSVPPLLFAEDEARALRKHGDVHAGALAIDRWYWDHTIRGLIARFDAGQYAEARSEARSRLPRLQPVSSRVRAFMWLAAYAPRVARWTLALRRTQR